MASLRQVNTRGRDGWQVRFSFQKQRKLIWLGGVDELDAKNWKRHVEQLVASYGKTTPAKATTLWLTALSADDRSKLSTAGLIEPDVQQVERKPVTFAELLESYLSQRKAEIKPRTFIALQTVADRLNEFFKASTSIDSITAMDARRFRKWLEGANKRDKPTDENGNRIEAGLAQNTVRRRIGRCRQFFKQAVTDGLIERNPFDGIPANVRSNKSRQHYVDRETFAKVLAKAPNARWRALLLFARLGALRVPSEVLGLRWSDIAWDEKRFTVHSPKTEHHEGRDTRIVPLFPELETELLALHLEAEPRAEFVFPGIDENTNLRTTLEKIIRRAGVQQWPKLWQNLRASGSTDLARTLPGHVAAAICGHTEQIAKEHYWQVAGSDLDAALNLMPRIGGHNGGHNVCPEGAIPGNSTAGDNLPESQNDQAKQGKSALKAVAGNCGRKPLNSRSGARTRTPITEHRILSPVCLPFHHPANVLLGLIS